MDPTALINQFLSFGSSVFAEQAATAGAARGNRFSITLQAFPPVFAEKEASSKALENSGRVILPAGVLGHLSSPTGSFDTSPMLFKITTHAGQEFHVGVLDFSAPEGMVYIPNWIMNFLSIEAGSSIKITKVSLPLATLIKIQPHRKAFIELSNPKVVLEHALKNYSCLSKGGMIRLKHAGEVFDIDVLETSPADAVCVVNCDVKVDFARPKDMPEEVVQPTPPPITQPTPETSFLASDSDSESESDDEFGERPDKSQTSPNPTTFSGSGRRLDGRPRSRNTPKTRRTPTKQPTTEAGHGFKPFTGKGRTLG